jgi:hypothetical protein
LSAPDIGVGSRINPLWKWAGVLVWLALAASLLAHYKDRLYSTSVDIGLHGTLVSRLIDSPEFPETDQSRHEMANYPPIAHAMAAAIGRETGSALDGMQWIAYLSVILLWSSVGYSMLRLPPRTCWIAFIGLAFALLANRQWIGLELFGSELVGNYFFAHVVAQSMAIGLLVIALQREWTRPKSISHLLILGLGAALLTSVHLLPSVELLGTLAVLVALSGLVETSTARVRHLLAGTLILLASLALIVLNPYFHELVLSSANNGYLPLKFFQSTTGMAVLSMLVALASLGMIALWWRKRTRGQSYEGLLLKYLGAFGLSIAGLCMLQVLLLAGFAMGSEYACFKYASALQSMLVVDVALLMAQLGGSRRRNGDSRSSLFAPAALAALACICVFPGKSYLSVEKINAAVRQARAFEKSHPAPLAGIHDLAIGIPGFEGIGDYLVSRIALGSPPDEEAYDILHGSIPKDARHIRWILTGESAKPWDVPACRRGTAGTLIAVDGACVFAAISKLACTGTINFNSHGALDRVSSGFSTAEPDGRWSEGTAAMLTCEREGTIPRTAYLESAGLVTDTHRQRMIVSVNDEVPQTIEFSSISPLRTVAIPLPTDNPSLLTFRFSFPDAISPQELAINDDRRKLAVMMYRLRFEP